TSGRWSPSRGGWPQHRAGWPAWWSQSLSFSPRRSGLMYSFCGGCKSCGRGFPDEYSRYFRFKKIRTSVILVRTEVNWHTEPIGAALVSIEAEVESGEQQTDTLSIGRRIRFFRKQRGLTLNELGQEVGRAASQISTIENGKRETSVTLLATIAKALRTDVADLIDPTPIDDRQALELEAERNQASPMYSSLGLPQVRIKSLPSDAL